MEIDDLLPAYPFCPAEQGQVGAIVLLITDRDPDEGARFRFPGNRRTGSPGLFQLLPYKTECSAGRGRIPIPYDKRIIKNRDGAIGYDNIYQPGERTVPQPGRNSQR